MLYKFIIIKKMDVHKFINVKSKMHRPKTIDWLPYTTLKYPPIKVDPLTWKIFSQRELTLTPGQVICVGLGLGFKSTKGVILTSLDYHLRYSECSLQNEISFGDAANIIVAITNNSKKPVKIKRTFMLRPLSLIILCPLGFTVSAFSDCSHRFVGRPRLRLKG